MLQIGVSLTDDSRGIIRDCNMFTAQATGVNVLFPLLLRQNKVEWLPVATAHNITGLNTTAV